MSIEDIQTWLVISNVAFALLLLERTIREWWILRSSRFGEVIMRLGHRSPNARILDRLLDLADRKNPRNFHKIEDLIFIQHHGVLNWLRFNEFYSTWHKVCRDCLSQIEETEELYELRECSPRSMYAEIDQCMTDMKIEEYLYLASVLPDGPIS